MKKLPNILSLLTLISLSSLSTVACMQQNNTFKIPLVIQENYVVQAINEIQDKQLTANFNPLTVKDILTNPIITNSSLNSKHEVKFTYDIKIQQTANTFLNNNFTYRIPEVSGNFILNLDSNKINNNNNNNMNPINYLIGNYQNNINNVDNILTGSTSDFTLIMNSSSFSMFNADVFDWRTNTKDLNNDLKNDGINNSNIILSKEDWQNILKNFNNISIDNGYAFFFHVIKLFENNFQMVYTNLTKQNNHNIPLPAEKPWLPLTAFNSTNDIEDGSANTIDNKFIFLNKDVLKELNDIYTDKSDYHNSNWNIRTIIQLLQTNRFCNTNLDLKTIATCLINNWNINLFNNFLASNHEYFLMQYDANNNYVKNNWNM